MCTAELALGAASTVMQGVQTIKSSNEQAAAAEYNRVVAYNNAQSVRTKANAEENAQRLETAKLLSKQRAQLGAANVDLSSGSAAAIQEDTVTQGEADALRIKTRGDEEYQSLIDESEYYASQADAADSSLVTGLTGTLLTGASTVIGTGVADKWFTSDSVFTVDSNSSALNLVEGL